MQSSAVDRKLRVTIFCARGLRQVGVFGRSDPYCMCEVPGKPWTKFRTATITNTLDPDWSHVREEIPGYAVGDPLQFFVLDRHVTSENLLGRAALLGETIFPDGFDGVLCLSDAG